MEQKIANAYKLMVAIGIVFLIVVAVTFQVQEYRERIDNKIEQEEMAIISTSDYSYQLSEKLDFISGVEECLLFNTIHQSVQVFIDDKLVYAYTVADNNWFGRTPGIAWHDIPLAEDDEGKTITIEISSPYEWSAKRIPTIYKGTYHSISRRILEQTGVGLLICLLTCVLGLVLMLISGIFLRKRTDDGGLIYLGLFAAIMGIWSLNELDIVSLILQQNLFCAYLSYISLMLMYIPMLLFLKAVFRKKSRIWNILCIICLVDMAVCIGLQIFNIADFRETLFAIQGLYVAAALTIVYMMYSEFRLGNIPRDVKINMFLLTFCVIGMGIDLFLYYSFGGDANILGRIAFLVYIISQAFSMIRHVWEIMRQGEKAAIYHMLAFKDSLTGVENRAALTRDIQETKIKDLKSCWVFMMDLNNLKVCNDCYGHAAGDQYIMEAAAVISNVFGGSGHTYRIGGDEFCVVLPRGTRPGCVLLQEQLEQEIRQVNNKEKKPQLGIAYGFAGYQEGDQSIYDLMKRADKQMYIKKNAMKNQCIASEASN